MSRSKLSKLKRHQNASVSPEDDLSERLAVYEACGVILELLAEEMKTINPTSKLSFVAYHRTGLERASEVVDRYRASVRLEREVPVTRVRFVA